MRRGIALAALTLVTGCGAAPPPDILAFPMPLEDRCGLRAIEQDGGAGFGPVRACAPPSDAELAMACRIAESVARDPDPQPGDPPAPMVEVRSARCKLTDAAHGKALCRFEQSVEGAGWTAAEAALTRTHWSYMGELVFERGISWYADGRCTAAGSRG